MKYPRLVRCAKTPCRVSLLSEPDEYNEQNTVFDESLCCNFQSSNKTVYTADKRELQLSAVCLFDGDIAPSVKTISSGTVTVFGIVHDIVSGQKCRNPDGSVNYTKLEVV